jgi:hypothetical protein
MNIYENLDRKIGCGFGRRSDWVRSSFVATRLQASRHTRDPGENRQSAQVPPTVGHQ